MMRKAPGSGMAMDLFIDRPALSTHQSQNVASTFSQLRKDETITESTLDVMVLPMSHLSRKSEIPVTVTDRIEINPKVMLGKPVIRGTRIPIELILRKLSEGATENDLLDAYPRLSREDIQAAILG
jgi:uncharacterized protein (DUF433 family)